jgi:hypothetical protein
MAQQVSGGSRVMEEDNSGFRKLITKLGFHATID